MNPNVFNRNIVNLKPSASLSFMMKAKEMKKKGIEVVDLAGGEPDFATPMPIVEEAYRQMKAGNTHYAVGKGIPQLQERIARKLKEENDLDYQPGEILVTPGAKFAIYVSVNVLLNAGEEAMYLEPAFVSYEPIISAAGGKPVGVPLSYGNQYRITREALEENVSEKTKLLIINYPNNPSGRLLSYEEAEILEQFLLDHPKIFLISDEIYERLIYDGKKNTSPAIFPAICSRVVTINGFSKSAAMTGWRLGYLAAPAELLDPMYKLYQHSVSCVSGFIQKAGVVALDCTEEIESMRKAYEERRNVFCSLLNEIKGVETIPADGAFYAWVKVEKEGIAPSEIGSYLLEHAKVVGVPGKAYGSECDGFIRFSIATDMENLKEAARRMKKALEE